MNSYKVVIVDTETTGNDFVEISTQTCSRPGLAADRAFQHFLKWGGYGNRPPVGRTIQISVQRLG